MALQRHLMLLKGCKLITTLIHQSQPDHWTEW